MADPLVTRKGILTFNAQRKGPPGAGVGLLSTKPIPMGLLQTCVGVQWGGLAVEFSDQG